MFTGLIREIGEIGAVERTRGGLRYAVLCPDTAPGLARGASVSVDGVCQTVTGLIRGGFTAEAVPSTLVKTTMREFRRGRRVNIEPALRAGDPLDGHILQGHVQRSGRLVSAVKQGLAVVLRIETETGPAAGIISEGSVGVDGISLTVVSCSAGEFSVSIIPETWNSTVINRRRPGDRLNIEGDLLLRATVPASGIDAQKLKEWGY